jgi:hypothetical protein
MAHSIYRAADGTRVPSVTTVTGCLDFGKSNALMRWASRLGLQGIDATAYRDETAEIGTLAHSIVECHLTGVNLDFTGVPEDRKNAALDSARSYFAWHEAHSVEPIETETEYVSEEHRYGGRIDVYARVDGLLTLLDIKTGKGLYLEHLVQVAGGYRRLLVENGREVERVVLLNVPRTDDETFLALEVLDWQIYDAAFLTARRMYDDGNAARKAFAALTKKKGDDDE